MKKFFIFVFLIISSYGQDLDSIVNSSGDLVRQYKMAPSLRTPLMAPDKLFYRDSTFPSPMVSSSSTLNFGGSSVQYVVLETRIRDLEEKATKIAVILENMQKVNEKHSDKFATTMNFFGILVTALAGIITTLIGVIFKIKK